MQLLTPELLEHFAKLGHQAEVSDPVVVAKFFNPSGAGTWFAVSYDPAERIFFGYVSIFGDHCDEWGTFSLDELESLRCEPFGFPIERDVHFKSERASKALQRFYRERGIKDPRA